MGTGIENNIGAIEKGFVVGEDFVRDNRKFLESLVNYFLAYPDMFVDYVLTPLGSTFRLQPPQRLFMRACMRYLSVFGTFPRGFSKTFLSILTMIIRCILLPGSRLFICTDTIKSAIKIAEEKFTEILVFFPMLKYEFYVLGGKSGSYLEAIFANGSYFDVIGVDEGTRGLRRHGGIGEEFAKIDGEKYNATVVPTMNVPRADALGRVNPNEPHGAEIYITTAGYKNSFAYDKLINILIHSVIYPKQSFVFGADYRLSVKMGRLSQTTINNMKTDTSYKEETFAREMGSIWSGSIEGAWIPLEHLLKHRVLMRIEKSAEKNVNSSDIFYIISVDVASKRANTAISVFKVFSKELGFIKKLVYLEVMNNRHETEQQNRIKDLYELYQPREIVVDATGMGNTFISGLNSYTWDESKQILRPGLGVINDPHWTAQQDPSFPKVIWALSTSDDLNNDIFAYTYSQLLSGKVKFLASEHVARAKLLATKRGQKMDMVERVALLKPYEDTSRLFDEIGNLRLRPTGNKIAVEQVVKRIDKDRFSSLCYGLWRIKYYEEEYHKHRRSSRDMGALLLCTPKGKGGGLFGRSRR